MAKYINRDELADWLKRIPLKDLSDGLGLCRIIMEEDFKQAIRTIPKGAIVDLEPVVHGHFVYDGPMFAGDVKCWHCSRCSRLVTDVGRNHFDYCPWCGARMDDGACNQECKYNTPDRGCIAKTIGARCDLENAAGKRGGGEAG